MVEGSVSLDDTGGSCDVVDFGYVVVCRHNHGDFAHVGYGPNCFGFLGSGFGPSETYVPVKK